VIAAWIVYALLVGALLALAAWLMEEVVRPRGGAVRFLWLGALLATVALAALAPLRATAPVSLTGAVLSRTEPADATVLRPDGGPAAAAARALEASRAALAATLERAAELGEGAAGTALAAGWALLTAASLALGAATLLRSRRARRAWPRVEMAGAPVRVAPRVGPAVLGIRRPEVVVPAWLLTAPPEEQRLVVMHEAEHVRARDPLTLAAGCVAVALVPWNPAAWWMLLRLRAAVEMDCDARVLRRGVERRAYGTLLIEMAGRGPGLSLGVPALAGSPSTLERRLRAMNARLPRFARLRATLLGVLAFAALASACESPLPTTAEIEKMDVAAVEARVVQLQPVQGGTVTYIVDGEKVPAQVARALPAGQIAQVDVAGGTAGNTVTIHTVRAAAQANARMREPVPVHVDTSPASTSDVVLSEGFHGLLVIDGVVSPASALRGLDHEGIERVEVIKGDAATRAYDDPRAANGVIRITTRAGAANR
jgi:beta-lactamase regulating signal transducer with metallopeptidase domain